MTPFSERERFFDLFEHGLKVADGFRPDRATIGSGCDCEIPARDVCRIVLSGRNFKTPVGEILVDSPQKLVDRTSPCLLILMSESYRPADNVLNRIIDHKRGEIAEAKRLRPLESLLEQLPSASPVRDFVSALADKTDVALIAEVKKASPSAGIIRADFDPLAIALTYQQHGAACLSVLTDENFFQGHLDFLRVIRREVRIPVLRKDFIIDRYQVAEARAAGADCILLIAECLDDCHLRDLYFYASELGMESLIEIYDPENLERVLKLEPALVGVNNRDLRSFVTDLDHTLRLAPRIPPTTLLVSESGIRSRADVDRLKAGGAHAMLVGETLMRSPDIGRAVDELLAN